MSQNPELNKLLFDALDHGIASVSNGETLIPFVIMDKKGKRTLQRIVTERIEEGPIKGTELIKKEKPDMYALAYEGFVTTQGKRFASVIVEAGDKKLDEEIVIAQRFKPKKFLSKFSTIGNPAQLASKKSLLK